MEIRLMKLKQIFGWSTLILVGVIIIGVIVVRDGDDEDINSKPEVAINRPVSPSSKVPSSVEAVTELSNSSQSAASTITVESQATNIKNKSVAKHIKKVSMPTSASSKTNNFNRPPELDGPNIQITETAQSWDLVRKIIADAGPEAVETGLNMLASDDPKIRQLGAMILVEQGALDDETIAFIASDADATVSLNTLGWLMDSGGIDQVDQLIGQLVTRGLEVNGLMDLMAGDELSESGSRAVLDLLSASMDNESMVDIFSTISKDDAYTYSVRMKAVVLLQDSMEFDDYRNHVNAISTQGDGSSDALWEEGIERLASRLEGPLEVHKGPAILTPDDIDGMLAREYPMILEDLAQRIEYILSHEDSYVKTGTAEHLETRLIELRNRPWESEQQVSLRRLEVAVQKLPALEDESISPPSNYVDPPPGQN